MGDDDDPTTVQVSRDLWRWLNRRREPGETMEDVIRREAGVDVDVPEPAETTPPSERVEEPRESAAIQVALPDSLPQRIDRQQAAEVVERVLEIVDDHGPVERTEIVERLDERHALGYDMSNRKGGWWRHIVKPALQENGCQYENGRGWTR